MFCTSRLSLEMLDIVAKDEVLWIDGILVDGRSKEVRNVLLKLMKRRICIVISASNRP